jgi:hypothetical protein
MARAIAYSLANDFTGGLNLRADQFQLAPNESPSLLNVEIDPRGGMFSRGGYRFLNSSPVSAAEWNPKSMYNFRGDNAAIMLSTGYIASTPGEVHYSTGGNFSRLNLSSGVLNVTNENGASFTQWEQTLYFVGGYSNINAYKWEYGDPYATTLTASGPTWQQYELPVGGFMPRANICKVHANKMFVAGTYEDGTYYPNRLRWSHEGRPEDWFDQDYIDINAGGEGIRGIEIVEGQLLIFKQKAVYLLMGYDVENFQLVEISPIHGIDYPQQACAGDGGVYFFDWPKGLYFYNRNGLQDIFLRINPIIANDLVNTDALDQITCSFVNSRLWLSMPYNPDIDAVAPDYAAVNFIFDQSIGKYGAYTMFRSSDGYALVTGTDWRSGNDEQFHIMCHARKDTPLSPGDEQIPFVYSIDDYNYSHDEEYDSTESPTIFEVEFPSYYRTSWFYEDRYVQQKSFVRPNYVVKEVDANTEIRVSVYYDFNDETIGRTSLIGVYPVSNGAIFGDPSYEYDDTGSVFGESTVAPTLYKGARLGRCNAIQLEFEGPSDQFTQEPGRKWGINSIAYKFKRRNIKG